MLTEQYAIHLRTKEHQNRYFDEIDMDDGIRIVDKLDKMFGDMHNTANDRFEKLKLENQI
jgi:hypothetical protein